MPNLVMLIPIVGVALIVLGLLRRSRPVLATGVALVALFVGASLVDRLLA